MPKLRETCAKYVADECLPLSPDLCKECEEYAPAKRGLDYFIPPRNGKNSYK